MNKSDKNPHAVALGRKGGLNSGGKRPGFIAAKSSRQTTQPDG